MVFCICIGAVFRDSADKVVQGKGQFEEIVVASNEITASTVQLVSATSRALSFIFKITLHCKIRTQSTESTKSKHAQSSLVILAHFLPELYVTS